MTSPAPSALPCVLPFTDTAPVALEVVLLAHDQAGVMADLVAAVVGHLDMHLELPWILTVADHASSDDTFDSARSMAASVNAGGDRRRLAAAGGEVRAVRLDEHLDRRALRNRFADSSASMVAFLQLQDARDAAAALAPLVGGSQGPDAPVARIDAAPRRRPTAALSRRLVGRRGALLAFGGVGLATVLAACGKGSSRTAKQTGSTAAGTTTGPAGTAATGSTSSAAAPVTTAAGTPASSAVAGALALTPEMTEGPYYLDLNLVRADIVEDRKGAARALGLTVLDTAGAPLSGAVVDIWHCDADGTYSGFVSSSTSANGAAGGPGGPPPGAGQGAGPGAPPPGGGGAGGPGGGATPTDKLTFLRGTQLADAAGKVAFQTVYPGWYQGRTVHIHVKVHIGGKQIHTGQLFFDDAFTDAVFAANTPYSARPARQLRNDGDGIFGGGGAQSILAAAKSGSGYAASLVLAVKPT